MDVQGIFLNVRAKISVKMYRNCSSIAKLSR